MLEFVLLRCDEVGCIGAGGCRGGRRRPSGREWAVAAAGRADPPGRTRNPPASHHRRGIGTRRFASFLRRLCSLRLFCVDRRIRTSSSPCALLTARDCVSYSRSGGPLSSQPGNVRHCLPFYSSKTSGANALRENPRRIAGNYTTRRDVFRHYGSSPYDNGIS